MKQRPARQKPPISKSFDIHRRLQRLPPWLSLCALVGFLVMSDAGYLFVQASFVVGDLFGSRPFSRVTGPTAEEQALFERVAAIREFGVHSLGLSESRSYTRYKRINRETLVWVVSGVAELSWERYQWVYPLLGPLPYRGYYRRRDAEREVERLQRAGYDAVLRRVTAFSFLGFLPDPLYSFAQTLSYASLADLILHEMTHATLFLRGQGSFNENLATLVGREGSRRFMAERYGTGSSEYLQMISEREDQVLFQRLVRELHGELRALYMRSYDLPAEEVRLAKDTVFRRFQEELSTQYDDLFTTGRYRWLADAELNNAVVDLFVTYTGDLELFRQVLDAHDGSIPDLLETLRMERSRIAAWGTDALRALLD